MPNSLSNPEKGLNFRKAAQSILERELHVPLLSEVALEIGKPPKEHRFDLVSEDHTWVLECKNLGWRANGGVPQAKITSISEAATCLCLVDHPCRLAIVMNRASHSRQRETLAEYYARLHRHQLREVALIEVDTDSGRVRWLVGHRPSK